MFDTDYYIIIKKYLKAIGYGTWKLHEDVTIQGSNPIEIVTPVMQGASGISQVSKFCNIISKYASTNDSCGLHVHVGAADFLEAGSAASRLTLALLHFKNFEPLFDSLVAANRRNNEFARSLDEQNDILTNYKQIISADAKKLDSMLNILTKGERYKKLNLESLAKHKTIEFRQMQGTVNAAVVKNWIVICMSFVDMVIQTEMAFVGLLKELGKAKPDPQRKESAANIVQSFRADFAGQEVKTSLSTNPDASYLINNPTDLSNNIRLDSDSYFDPSLQGYYYLLSVPMKTFSLAAGITNKPGVPGSKTLMIDSLAWNIRTALATKYPGISTVTRSGKVFFYIKNNEAPQRVKGMAVSPEESNKLLTTQKNLATRSGMPKGISSRAISSIKNNQS